jgi:hypothetical protein
VMDLMKPLHFGSACDTHLQDAALPADLHSQFSLALRIFFR